jgi:hypothetical protein
VKSFAGSARLAGEWPGEASPVDRNEVSFLEIESWQIELHFEPFLDAPESEGVFSGGNDAGGGVPADEDGLIHAVGEPGELDA